MACLLLTASITDVVFVCCKSHGHYHQMIIGYFLGCELNGDAKPRLFLSYVNVSGLLTTEDALIIQFFPVAIS